VQSELPLRKESLGTARVMNGLVGAVQVELPLKGEKLTSSELTSDTVLAPQE
jgi:hypothetical protein